MDVGAVVARAAAYGVPFACITGGEPLLQEETAELARELTGRGMRVSVETNGSIDASGLPGDVKRIIDIKCPGSGEAGKTHPANLTGRRLTDEFKFVLTDRRDFDYAREFIGRHDMGEGCTLLLSPAWGALRPAALAAWITSELPSARLNLQLHRYIWPDDNRGR
jgi:7-carboxy-7-deazaguanine synthase